MRRASRVLLSATSLGWSCLATRPRWSDHGRDDPPLQGGCAWAPAGAGGRRHALPVVPPQPRAGGAERRRFVQQGGANAVKIEGGAKRVPVVEALLEAEIPVMGHVGLTPQSYHLNGCYRVQGASRSARSSCATTRRPWIGPGSSPWCSRASRRAGGRDHGLGVGPTIGIGAGAGCDGQVLVFHDAMGLSQGVTPRFVRRYAELGKEITKAVTQFAADVKSGAFRALGSPTTPWLLVRAVRGEKNRRSCSARGRGCWQARRTGYRFLVPARRGLLRPACLAIRGWGRARDSSQAAGRSWPVVEAGRGFG